MPAVRATLFKNIIMKQVLVIHEKDLDDNEYSVIGVADSLKDAERMIDEYYGDYEEVAHYSSEDQDIAYSNMIELKHSLTSDKTYRVLVWLEWFVVNEV